MGLQAAPAYIGSGSYAHPATLDRAIIKQMTGRQSGCFAATDFVVAPTTGLNVTVTAGAVSILGVDIPASQGHYFAWSDATETIACVAPHASLKRVDALILRTVDPSYSAGPTPGAVWTWISGTAASSPVAPTDSDIQAGGNYRPGSWIRIANVQINNGDTVVDPTRIFDTRTFTVGANGVQLIPTSAAQPTGIAAGHRTRSIATGVEYVYSGSAWLELAQGNATRVLAAKSITPGGVAPTSGATTRVLLTNFNLTNVPLVNGRWYRLSYEFSGAINGGEQAWSVLKTGTTISDGTDLLLTVIQPNPSANSRLRVKASVLYQATSTGTMNFTSVVYRNTASVTSMTFGGSGANDPGTFMCEDIGESGLVTAI